MFLILATLTVEARANPLASATTMTGAIVVANLFADYTNSTPTAPPMMLGASGKTCGTNGKLTDATDYPLEYLYCSPRSCVNLASQWFNGNDGADDVDDICDCPRGYLPESFPTPANVQQTRRHFYSFWTTYRTDDLFITRCKHEDFWNDPCSRDDPLYYSNYNTCHDIIGCGDRLCYSWATLHARDEAGQTPIPDSGSDGLNTCPKAYYTVEAKGENTAGEIIAFFENADPSERYCKRCRSQQHCARDWHQCLKSDAKGYEDASPYDDSSTDLGCHEATPGYYINAGVVTPCTPVPNAITYTCTGATDSVPSACAPGYVVTGTGCEEQ